MSSLPVTVNVIVAEVEVAADAANVTVGAAVSYVMLSGLLAVLLLPAASVKVLPATEIEAVPDELEVGVNVTV
jgi:hypothetical protein